MPEKVQRTRFERWLKNLTGFRAGLPLDIPNSIAPGYDFSEPRIELDDEQAYWYGSVAQAAVVGQFSFSQVKCLAGRAVTDSTWIRQMAAAGLRIGRTPDIAGAGQPVCLRNVFLGSPIGSLGSVVILSGSQVADPFATGCSIVVDQQAAGGVAQNIVDKFVSLPGFAFTVSPGSVNTALTVSFLGRWLADQQ